MASVSTSPVKIGTQKTRIRNFNGSNNMLNSHSKGGLLNLTKKDCAGWLGMWLGQQGQEICKTFTWDAGQEDDPAEIIGKFENYVKPAKNKRVARFKAHQRKQNEGDKI